MKSTNMINRRALMGSIFALALSVPMATVANPNDPSKDLKIDPVKVHSFHVFSGVRGKMMVSCTKRRNCNRYPVNFYEGTELSDNGHVITFAEAAKLEWRYAILATDKNGRVKSVTRVPRVY